MAIWKEIDFLGEGYSCSNKGEIKTLSRWVKNNSNGGKRLIKEKILSQKTKSNGYKEVSLSYNKKQKSFYVHRLIAKTFIGDIDGYEVNHKDGDKSNNNVDNLEIVTSSQNRLHSYHVLGNKTPSFKGEKHPMANLKKEQVLSIRGLYDNGKTPKFLSNKYNIPYSTVCKICYRQTWKHI